MVFQGFSGFSGMCFQSWLLTIWRFAHISMKNPWRNFSCAVAILVNFGLQEKWNKLKPVPRQLQGLLFVSLDLWVKVIMFAHACRRSYTRITEIKICNNLGCNQRTNYARIRKGTDNHVKPKQNKLNPRTTYVKPVGATFLISWKTQKELKRKNKLLKLVRHGALLATHWFISWRHLFESLYFFVVKNILLSIRCSKFWNKSKFAAFTNLILDTA